MTPDVRPDPARASSPTSPTEAPAAAEGPAAVADRTTGLLERAVAEIGGTPRPGQRQMAHAVAAAAQDGHHLLVQAGTGTGKSVGYLVPAVDTAIATGRPVVISSSTLALQAQIVEKDLPAVVSSLEDSLPRRPEFALLKGRSNYVCKHKLAGGYPDDLERGALFAEASVSDDPRDSERLGAQVVRLREWAETTSTGDRDDLDTAVSDRAWRQVSVTSAQCLGAKCPLYDACFVEQNRALAREADVVVTNHALLAIDAFDRRGLVPEHDLLIVDEAHDLSQRVTSAVTDEISAGLLTRAARDLRGLGGTAKDLESAAETLRTALSHLSDGRVRGDLPADLADALVLAGAAARDAHGAAKDLGDRSEATTAGARNQLRATLAEVQRIADRVLDRSEWDVVWLRRLEDQNRDVLYVAPLTVANSLREALLAERTVVMTSATLAQGGAFDAAAGTVGLRADERIDPFAGEPVPAGDEVRPWAGLDVGSPFDYARQSILYVARDLPNPGRDGAAPETLARLRDLVEAADGGTLGLFSSRRGAEDAARFLREVSDLPVLLQGEESMAGLVRAFRADRRTSLFGTLSLWQGVDVPGDACRLVVIDRIPFPRPDDPLGSARTEWVGRHGGNGFMQVSARHAALLLAQGAGRLVRSTSDRGMVAVLDPRLVTARYGGHLMSALPPFWRTTDPSTALGALRRLAAVEVAPG